MENKSAPCLIRVENFQLCVGGIPAVKDLTEFFQSQKEKPNEKQESSWDQEPDIAPVLGNTSGAKGSRYFGGSGSNWNAPQENWVNSLVEGKASWNQFFWKVVGCFWVLVNQ